MLDFTGLLTNFESCDRINSIYRKERKDIRSLSKGQHIIVPKMQMTAHGNHILATSHKTSQVLYGLVMSYETNKDDH